MSAEKVFDQILDVACRERKDRPFRFGVSTAGDCQRKSFYAATEPAIEAAAAASDTPPRWNMAAILGTAFGEWIEYHAKRIGCQTQVPVIVSEDPPVHGTADVVGPDFVADCKLVGFYEWDQAKKRLKPEYQRQVHTYAASLGKPVAAIWYARNNPRGEIIERKVYAEPTDPSHREWVIDRWRGVQAAIKSGTTPPPEHQKRDSIECKTCRFFNRCEKEW